MIFKLDTVDFFKKNIYIWHICVLYVTDVLPILEHLERNSAEEKLLEDLGSYDEVVNLHLAFTFNIM